MKTRTRVILTALSMVAIAALSIGQTAYAQKGVTVGSVAVVTAEIVGIDKADRTVTLRGPRGNVATLEVGEEARNFDQVKVGDTVEVQYYQAVALYLGKHGQQPRADAGMVVARAPKGAKPAGYAIGAVDVAATVQAIDRTNRIVTLKGPHGHLVDVTVDESLEGFDKLKVGDLVHARHTEAIAISVTTR